MLMGSPYSGTMTMGGMTLRSRGSTDTFVAKLLASDGSGVWAIDAGGSGMEYPWGFDVDSTGATYLAGLTNSETVSFGGVSKTNAMHKDNGGDGNYQLFLAKLGATEALPSCLSSCPAGVPTVAPNKCFIDGACYDHGDTSPYGNLQCLSCDYATSSTTWEFKAQETHCFIDGACYAEGEYKPGPSSYYGSSPPDACKRCSVGVSTSSWTDACAAPAIEFGQCYQPSFEWLLMDQGSGSSMSCVHRRQTHGVKPPCLMHSTSTSPSSRRTITRVSTHHPSADHRLLTRCPPLPTRCPSHP